MSRAHIRWCLCTLVPVAVSAMLTGCDSTPPVSEASQDEPAVEQAVRVLATSVSAQAPEPVGAVTAEIVDVIDGGKSGEWGVKVLFPNGTGDGCYVEVADKRSGDLLARDDVNRSPDVSHEHLVRFRHRGNRETLRVRVTEKSSGGILADYGT